MSFLLWSSSVWLWYVLALCSGWTTDAAKWFLGIGSAVWIWWASPVGSPFILLVTFTAIGIKAIFNKIKNREKKSHRKKRKINPILNNISNKNAQNSQKCDKKHENKDF